MRALNVSQVLRGLLGAALVATALSAPAASSLSISNTPLGSGGGLV